MILLALLAMAVVALLPLAWNLRRQAALRGRRESALEVHRGQLAELQRDAADGRIPPAEHASAVVEVQRRLLAADGAGDTLPPAGPAARAGRDRLILAGVLTTVAAFALYMVGGHPELPAAPLAERIARASRQAAESESLIAQLRARVATLDPKSETAREGYVLLGNAEQSLAHFDEAATAWRAALAVRFDPELAVAAAELQSRADGRVSPEAAALFRAALAAGPQNAPWRPLAEQRLAKDTDDGGKAGGG